MSAYDVVQFDGTTLGTGTDYDAWLDARDEYVMTSAIDTITRRSASPLVTGTAEEGRTITLHIANAAGSSLTAAEFRDAVKTLFDSRKNAMGERTLVIVGDDGSTNVQIGVYVAQWAYLSQGVDEYVITLWARQNYWQATTVTESDPDPATVTNAGNTIAYPTIELTTGTHVTRRACTVTGAGAGGGLIAYPVRFDLSDANATSTNVFVYVEGVSVPCYVMNSGLSTSAVWALVDTASDGTTATNVDIIYGTGPTNPLAGTLDDAGMAWTNGSVISNTSWIWSDWSTVTSNPPRPGAWRPALTGEHNDAADVSYGISSSGNNVIISLGAAGSFDNRADSVRLHVGAKAGTTNALSGMSRVTANLDGSNARSFVKYRVANSSTWVTAVSTTTNGTATSAVDLDNAVEIVVGLENFGSTADPATLTISANTTLALASNPTVVVGSATDMDIYDGDYTIGDRTISFTNLIVPDGTLSINCESRTITSSVAGPFYGDEDALTFSHPDQWLLLNPGSNTVTDGLSATDVVKHQEAWI